MAILLNTKLALKCAADGIFSSTGSDGPGGLPEARSFKRIRRAPLNDLASTIQRGDFDNIEGLRMEVFVEGDCDALTDDRIEVMWTDALRDVKHYWEMFPTLPNPFPVARFIQPDVDCQTTTVGDIATSIIQQWEGAQA
ncbi:MAG: hypothetical protein JWN14_4404 [Chthonomonadales bacterium]|nr:hypothetical protein [Chthonomonadales bacterium]